MALYRLLCKKGVIYYGFCKPLNTYKVFLHAKRKRVPGWACFYPNTIWGGASFNRHYI